MKTQHRDKYDNQLYYETTRRLSQLTINEIYCDLRKELDGIYLIEYSYFFKQFYQTLYKGINEKPTSL